MAYVVPRGHDRFEIREAVRTARGPRSRTLATFRELTPDVVAQARERAGSVIDEEALRAAVRRAGGTVVEAPVDVAAARLYRELAVGARPRRALVRLIASELRLSDQPTDAERAAGAWLTSSLEERGHALRDLLALTDRLPAPKRPAVLRFPRLVAEQ